MAENTEREDWEELTGCRGWGRFCRVVIDEFTERERVGTSHALDDRDDNVALNKLRQLHAAKKAVEWALTVPDQRLKTLVAGEASRETTGSRRGRL